MLGEISVGMFKLERTFIFIVLHNPPQDETTPSHSSSLYSYRISTFFGLGRRASAIIIPVAIFPYL